jgi:hypothetical protein
MGPPVGREPSGEVAKLDDLGLSAANKGKVGSSIAVM